MLKATILGTGDPLGSPPIFQKGSTNRLRPSLLVEHGETTLLFDASPDVRQQLLHTKTSHLDAVFITHLHFDHFWGAGDLAQLTWTKKNTFPVYVNAPTKEVVESHFAWIDLDFQLFSKPMKVGQITVTPFAIDHSVELHGFIIEADGKKIIYAPDMLTTKNPSQDADLLVIDGMYILGKYMDDPDHASGEELQSIIDSFRAKKVGLVGYSEYWYKRTAQEMMSELGNKYIIPDDFDSLVLA